MHIGDGSKPAARRSRLRAHGALGARDGSHPCARFARDVPFLARQQEAGNNLAKTTKNGPCAAYGYLAMSGPDRTAYAVPISGVAAPREMTADSQVRTNGTITKTTTRGAAATRDRKRAARKNAG